MTGTSATGNRAVTHLPVCSQQCSEQSKTGMSAFLACHGKNLCTSTRMAAVMERANLAWETKPHDNDKFLSAIQLNCFKAGTGEACSGSYESCTTSHGAAR